MTEVFHHHHHHHKYGPNKKDWVHTQKWKNIIDKLVFTVSLTGILMTMPQLYMVWFTEDIAGVSLVSWAWYTFSASFWVLYGVAHKEKMIIMINILWALVQALIVIGIIIH